jgi:malonyl-CoA O-methyltransferase
MLLQGEYLPATKAPRQDLVLLHGWGCNRDVWRPLLAQLRPWANVTLLTLPGCAPALEPAVEQSGGASGAADNGLHQEPDHLQYPEKNGEQNGEQNPEQNPEQNREQEFSANLTLPDLLTAILDASPARAVYVGWSLGGQLATLLAAQYPERVAALVTLCSNPLFVAADGWPGMNAADFQSFSRAVESDPAAALKRFNALQVLGASSPKALLRKLPSLTPRSANAALCEGLGWLQVLDLRDSLCVVDQPQLHMFASADALVPVEVSQRLASLLADNARARVTVIPKACHLMPLEVPEAVATDIEVFLQAMSLLCVPVAVTVEVEKKAVAASFSRAAAAYDSVAQLQRDVGDRLLGQLDECQIEPQRVLDLGCGTGYFSPALKSRYPAAHHLGLDLAEGMVGFARSRCGFDSDWLVADAESLPLASESIDLVFSSLAVQWCFRPEHLFAELARVLRPGGVCVFTSLGPHTLKELASAWATVDAHQHVNKFLPRSDLMSAAQRVRGAVLTLQDRVYRMEYTRVRDLLDELKALGAHNMNRSRPQGLTSRRALQGMLQAYESQRSNGLLPATYDVIFGEFRKL